MSWMTGRDRTPEDAQWEIDLAQRLGGIDKIRTDSDERGRIAQAQWQADRDQREHLEFQRAHADHDSCSGPAIVGGQPIYNRGCLGALLLPMVIPCALFILLMQVGGNNE